MKARLSCWRRPRTAAAFAFQNPDGSVVTTLFNEGTASAATTLSIDGTLLQFQIPARGWATVVWQQSGAGGTP